MTRSTKQSRKASAPQASSKEAARGKKTTKASGKAAEKATSGSLAAAKRKAEDDPFAFDGDEMTDAMFGVIVKWVNRGKTTSEWAFQAASDTTVGQLKSMVDETTDGVLKPHAMIMTHKSKSMDDSDALLTDYGISDGSEVVLMLNHEGNGVPPAPTMVAEFPGEPVTKKAKKEKTGAEKKRERFSKAEALDLIKGVELYGLGQWAQIKQSYFASTTRSGVDLKDKWRNLMTAAQRPPGFKFRVDYLNEPELLSRVLQVNEEALNKVRSVTSGLV